MTNAATLASIFKRRFFPALVTFSGVLGGACAYLSVAEPAFQAKARLVIDDTSVSVSELGQNLTRFANSQTSDPIAAQAELVTSNRILDYTFQSLVDSGDIQEGSPIERASQIRQFLSVKIVPATNFLDIMYEGQEPELTAKVVNALANAVVKLNAEEIRREASSVRSFLDVQIPQQQAKLQEVEAIETQYRQSTGLIDAPTQTASLVGSLSALEDRERDLLDKLQAASTQRALLQDITGFEQPKIAYIATRVGQDEDLKNLNSSLLQINEDIAVARSRFQDDHPQILALVQQRNDLQELYKLRLTSLSSDGFGASLSDGSKASNPLSEELISQYILRTVDEQSIYSQIQLTREIQQSMQSKLVDLPAKRQQLNEIERKRDELSSGLDLLQQKQQEARIAEAQLVGNVQIVDYASVPGDSSSPKAIVLLILAGVAGSSLAAGVVLLLELLDGRLHSVSEIQAGTDVPVIGVLPRNRRRRLKTKRLSDFLDHSSAIEPYRSLLKSIEASSMRKSKVMVFTSTRRGEGKSDVVARLGMVAAMLGRKVLLIDADLSLPRQHEIFGLSISPGLTQAVVGQVETKKSIYNSGINNLDVLPRGDFAPRPSTITESSNIRHLIELVSSDYDLILIDSPPMMECADATTLSQYSDGLICTVRPNLTERDDLTEAVMTPRKAGINVMGVVVNNTATLTDLRNEDEFGSKLAWSDESDDKLRLLHDSSRSSL